MQNTKRNYTFVIPILLLVLFVGPFLVAASLYSARNPLVEETINHGKLLQPPLDFSQVKLLGSNDKAINTNEISGQWLMLYVAPTQCMDICRNNLYKMRQIWVSLGKDMDRVQRIIVTPTTQSSPQLHRLLAKEYVGTQHLLITPTELTQFFGQAQVQQMQAKQGALYFVDPHANVMMMYAADAAPKGILTDLKRLLNLSQIG